MAILVTIEEISQLFIRGRTFDWTDLIADFLGIFIMGELAKLIFLKFFAGDKGWNGFDQNFFDIIFF